MADATDIFINIPKEKELQCEICNKKFVSKAGIGPHISRIHKMSYEEYIIKFYNNGVKPLCPICNKETRYLKGICGYKKYCVDHANESRSEWSKNNGYGAKQDAGWKRGLTKETNEIVRRHSEWMKGENNPMHRDNPRNKKDDNE